MPHIPARIFETSQQRLLKIGLLSIFLPSLCATVVFGHCISSLPDTSNQKLENRKSRYSTHLEHSDYESPTLLAEGISVSSPSLKTRGTSQYLRNNSKGLGDRISESEQIILHKRASGSKRPPPDSGPSDSNKRFRGDADYQKLLAAQVGGITSFGQESEVANNPPQTDPAVNKGDLAALTLRSVVDSEEIESRLSLSIRFLNLVQRAEIISTDVPYQIVGRILRTSGPASSWPKLISDASVDDQIIIASLDEQTPKDTELFPTWLYESWYRASDPAANEQRTALKYIIIENYVDDIDLDVLESLVKKWGEWGFVQPDSNAIIMRLADIDFEAVNKQDSATFKYLGWTVLYSLQPAKAVAKMLSTWPNSFWRHRISVIRFAFVPWDLSITSTRTNSVSFLFELEPITARVPETSAIDDVFRHFDVVSGQPSQPAPEFHPCVPDIYRTSYVGYLAGLDDISPTFLPTQWEFGSLVYKMFASTTERHLVFEGYGGSNDGKDISKELNLEADLNLPYVMYAGWVEQAGVSSLLRLTFAALDPRSSVLMARIRELKGIKSDDVESTAILDEGKPYFDVMTQASTAFREGKVLDFLVKNHGNDLGVRGISRYEIGIYTTESTNSPDRKGKYFLMVTFTPARNELPVTPETGLALQITEGLITSPDVPFDPRFPMESQGSGAISLKAIKLGSRAFATGYANLVYLGNQLRPSWLPIVYLDLITSSSYLYIAGFGEYNGGFSTVSVPKDAPFLQAEILRYDIYNYLDDSTVYPLLQSLDEQSTGKLTVNYYGAQVGLPGDSTQGTPYRYTVAMSADNYHLVVLSVPIEQRRAQIPIEDALYGAWYKTFSLLNGHAQAKFAVITFLEVSKETEDVLDIIYQLLKLKIDRALPYKIKDPTPTNSVDPESGPVVAVNPKLKQVWLLLLGTAEIYGTQALLVKYRNTYSITDVIRISAIAIRWAENSDKGLRAQLTISFKSGKSSKGEQNAIVKACIDNNFREYIVLGLDIDTVSKNRLGLDAPHSVPELGDSEFQLVGPPDDSAPLPEAAVELIRSQVQIGFDSKARGSEEIRGPDRFLGILIAAKSEFDKLTIVTRTENLGNIFFLGFVGTPVIGDPHTPPIEGVEPIRPPKPFLGELIVPTMPAIPGTNFERAGKLGRMICTAWKYYIGQPPGLQHVAFETISPQTQATIRLLWASYAMTKGANKQVNLKVFSTGKAVVPGLRVSLRNRGEGLDGFTTRIKTLFYILLGTAEVGGVGKCLETSFDVLGLKVVSAVYIWSDAKGENTRIVVRVDNAVKYAPKALLLP
ncbi:hypothetical protein TWF694_010149 [Orbilia ellipsospora]|uniref:Uncharacterized protein n=1 Tax=Orbilia ellipsospora TaxID=2528407 RepID=A0AAV9X903_9PEZI